MKPETPTMSAAQGRIALATMLLIASVSLTTGCSPLRTPSGSAALPTLPMPNLPTPSLQMPTGLIPKQLIGEKAGDRLAVPEEVQLVGSNAADVLRKVQEAKGRNALVLQVDGDSQPVRILPMPPDGKPVYVSDLIKQTGLQKRFGRMNADLFRASTENPGGIRMKVEFLRGSSNVRPESDYALRSGDRLRVRKDNSSALAEIIETWIPSNALGVKYQEY
ncbi:MAG: hypothetical protein AAFP90_00850 [Planctomycetota bacterium]